MSSHTHKVDALVLAQVNVPPQHFLRKMPFIFGVIGVLGLAASLLLSTHEHEQFYFSYLTSYVYFLSIALGSLFFVLIQFATRAGWSVVVRRVAESAMVTLPILALLFIPLLFGTHSLFHWTHHDVRETDNFIRAKAPYLNESFLWFRTIVYFVIWSLVSLWIYRNSTSQDQTGDHKYTYRLQKWSYLCIALFGLSVTFFAFDWIMSLEPHWYSTIYGVYYFASSVVSSLAMLICLTAFFKATGILKDFVTVHHFYDLGKLVFGFTVFWAYIAFSQYFLQWYANIPEETVWFYERYSNGWGEWSVLLAVGHFVAPFLFLMSRTIKKNLFFLALGAVWLLAMHYVDMFWLVMPTLHKSKFTLSLLDLTCFVGIGGIFLAAITTVFIRRAVIPCRDPRLPESLHFENV